MHRFCVISIACLCLLSSSVGWCQMPVLEPSKVNLARLRWLQYKLIAGRVVAHSNYPEGMNISFGPSVIDGRLREHLQLLILKDRASIQYEMSGDGLELAIELADSGEFSIRHKQRMPAVECEFRQPPNRPLSLRVVREGTEQTCTAESFWHLYLAAPELVRSELIPYLELLRPAWQLAATGAAIEDTLVRYAQQPHGIDTAHWHALVERLGSERFSERQQGERELRRIGQLVLPFLEDLNPRQLDAEQTARVAKLIKSLSVDYEDATDRVANWLAGDRRVWLSLLERDDLLRRRVAARQFALLAGRPIEFDPEGSPALRAEQVARLRERLAVELPPQATGPIRSDAGPSRPGTGPNR